jgi:hypothetical protein
MLQRRLPAEPTTPLLSILVVVEEPFLAAAGDWATDTAGLDVRLCSGQTGKHESCPLVGDGACPMGPCDVVVCNLDRPWATPVQRAWRRPRCRPSATKGRRTTALSRRVVGAALQLLWRARLGDDPSREA